ncbi:unnamed protein product [Eruca vesicaria subsp. sativa]|uniref:RING-type E3 ubiquitin transferase n=1 Tax=Eruca vesicaria subsp. sativa TaxID=29727 RepID=A0ABC8JQR4_ERUVS|nr:unnamed protein product [Eruca vesicaria subsp. sativa]
MNTQSRIILIRSIISHHGSSLQLLLFLVLFSSQASAETHNGSDMYGESSRFDPTMAILMIVLVSVFFALGFFSIYIRRCLERCMGSNNQHPLDLGGNWLSLNRPQARGLDASVIETFPMFRYSTVKTLKIGKEALECPVCLNEFEDDETLRLLPKCCHVFHPGCVDAWLRSHATCPLCRASLVPVPGEPVVSVQIPGLAHDAPRSGLTGDSTTVLSSPDVRLIDSVALTGNQSMSRRSLSTGRNLTGFDWTGQHVENLDRFTLRLPLNMHNKLVDPSLSKSHVELPQVMSPTSGYRTGGLETDRNYFYYERFDDQDGRFDRRPFSITPPFRTCSINTSPCGGGDQVRASTPKSLLLAMKSPFDRLFLGKSNNGERSLNNNIGERSSDHLRSSDASSPV